MKFSLTKFAALAKVFAPLVLVTVNPKLAPLANDITAAITTAEAMPGATGAQKLEAVRQMAAVTIDGINQTAGHVVVDPAGMDAAVVTATTGVITVLNALHPVIVETPLANAAQTPVKK